MQWYEVRFKIKGWSKIKWNWKHDKFINGLPYFLHNHYVVPNSFDIVKQVYSNFLHKILLLRILMVLQIFNFHLFRLSINVRNTYFITSGDIEKKFLIEFQQHYVHLHVEILSLIEFHNWRDLSLILTH